MEFIFFPHITKRIHQEANSGQQSVLSPCVQSQGMLVFVWPRTVTHSNKATSASSRAAEVDGIRF